jgi:excisionase family DNA binding protein
MVTARTSLHNCPVRPVRSRSDRQQVAAAHPLPWPDEHLIQPKLRRASEPAHTKGCAVAAQPSSNTAADTRNYLRTAEVADILHVSPKTVSRWAKEGKLPFLRTLGGHRRYSAAQIRQLADELQVRPTA